MMSKIFTIVFIYFKRDGKFYASAETDRRFSILGNGHCNMEEVANWVNSIIKDGKENLPGLASNKWNGFISIDCEKGYPHLFLPS